jgi:hypothetical protein
MTEDDEYATAAVVCPKCQAAMRLIRIEPLGSPGDADRVTYRCEVCDHGEQQRAPLRRTSVDALAE